MFESLKLDGLIQLQEKIDARVMRERVLIFLTLLAFVFMLWNFVVQSAIDTEMQTTRAQLDTLATQRATMQTQISAATQNLLNDPDKQKKAQIIQLQTDISGLDNQLKSLSQDLINAEQLPRVLQEILQKTAQLTLLEVNTLPALELQFVAVGAAKGVQPEQANNNEMSAGVFQHAVELRVSGSYSQVVQFLIALEQLPWRFYWQSLDYSVAQYPNAEVMLRVYTLSSEEGLFGV